MAASKDMPPFGNFLPIFFNNQFRVKIELPSLSNCPSMAGKTVLITGANAGLGFAAAQHLLSLETNHLIMGIRSMDMGRAASEILKKNHKNATIEVWSLDMESYDSIGAFARQCADLPRLDLAILNAGTSPINFAKSPETGNESTIQVNHLGTALLAMLLLPILKKRPKGGDPGRLTVVNSVMAHLCKFATQDERPLLPALNDSARWDPDHRYGISKLLNQIFLVKLADQVDCSQVIINMVDPGLTKGTGLFRDLSGFQGVLGRLALGVAGRTPEAGAALYAYGAVKLGQESHGCFLMNGEVSPLSGYYYKRSGPDLMDQAWEETMAELSFAGVEQIISNI